MIRIDNATAVGTRPTIDAAGTPGWWTNGDPGIPTPATIVEADFLNDLQAIIMAILTAGSVTPTKGPGGDNDLLTALQAVIGLGLPQGHLVGQLKRTGDGIVQLQPLSGVDVLVGIDDAVLANTGSISFDMASHLDGGEAASTPYYLYLRNQSGSLDQEISATAPDLPAGTKPGYKSGDTTRRCVGSIWNNASQHFINCTYGPGGEVLFHEHDADHEYALALTKSTSWQTEVALNLPVTAVRARINASGLWGNGEGMAVYGAEGATGTLTDASADASLLATILAASAVDGTSNADGFGIQFDLPIVTPAAPKLAYGLTETLSADHVALVLGYTDVFGPR